MDHMAIALIPRSLQEGSLGMPFTYVWHWFFLALLTLSQGGCAAIGDGQQPLSGWWYRAEADRQDTLWVLLPGRYDKVTAFEKHGWIAKARQAGIRADIEVVDAYLDYYMQRTVVPRLHEDVILPARRAGYRRIILVGVSMGAAGALRYWQYSPSEIDRVILIAPYRGEPELLEEIRRSGGVHRWSSDKCPPDNLCQMWKSFQAEAESGELAKRVVLLYGQHDRLVEGDRLLQPLLDPGHVVAINGGHDWSTWNRLWSIALQKGLLNHP